MNAKPNQTTTAKTACKKLLNFPAVDGMQQSLNRPAAAAFNRPVVILGPTTVGKTEVAFGLARRLNAAVINANKFYLYDALPEVTGQSDADQYPDITSQLYGRQQPDEPLWTLNRYRAELRSCLVEAAERNHVTGHIKNPPVGVTSKPATPRCEGHNRFKVGFKVCSVSASAAYRE